MDMNKVIKDLIDISIEAGNQILEVYDESFEITLKEDLSPLTDADRKSNNVPAARSDN